MEPIEWAKSLWGVRHWAFWDKSRTPNYEVYRYQGKRGNTYVFMSINGGIWLALTYKQIEAWMEKKTFWPFVIDVDAILEATKGQSVG